MKVLLLAAALVLHMSVLAFAKPTWSGWQPFSDNITQSYNVSATAIAGDRKGNFVALWDSTDNGQIYVSRSADDGLSWEAALPLPTGTGTVQDPEIAYVSQGTYAVTWQDISIDQIEATLTTDHGLTWGSPITLSAGSALGMRKMAASPTGGVVVIFDLVVGSTSVLYFARSADAGLAYTLPQPLTTPTADYNPGSQITWTANSGFLVAAYGTELLKSEDGGANWTAIQKFPQEGVVIALASNGHNHVIAATRQDNIVSASVSTDTGQSWDPPVELASGYTNLASASIAYKNKKEWALVRDELLTIGVPYPNFGSVQGFLTKDNGVSWTRAGGELFGTDHDDRTFPRPVIASGKETFVAHWRQRPYGTLKYLPVFAIVTKEKLPGFAVVWDSQPSVTNVDGNQVTSGTLTISNSGRSAKQVILHLYVGGDNRFENSDLATTLTIDKLRKDETLSVPVQIPNVPIESTLFALVDGNFEFIESNEQDNLASIQTLQ